MDEIRQRCAEVFSRVMQVEPSDITEETSPDTLPEWDSLAHVQLVLELEKAFAVKISPEEGIDLDSFRKVCSCIGDKSGN